MTYFAIGIVVGNVISIVTIFIYFEKDRKG
nr:MAG TPA: hypothetical protein [Caudoviricetes sp.]